MSSSARVIVDGSSYLFRAYYAMPPLTNAAGEPTGAIYGVLNMLRGLEKTYSREQIVIVFDPPGKTTRHEWYPDYKANRSAMPEDLQQQIAPLHAIIEAIGLPLVIESGIEADDVIGTLAVQAVAAGESVIISTGDKDMAQLVNAQVKLVNTMKDEVLDVAGVEQKFGVSPERIVDYLSLMGDSADNIPGVPKVGPKTAVKWLQAYGSLDEVMAHADEIKGKVGENLRASFDALALARRLVTIDCQIHLSQPLSQLSLHDEDKKILAEWYQRLEFRAWLNALSQGAEPRASGAVASSSASSVKTEYELVLTESQLAAWVARLEKVDVFALDTETTGLDDMSAELVGISVSDRPGSAAYIPVMHQDELHPPPLDKSLVLQALQPLLNDSTKTLVGQNCKYDAKILFRQGVTIGARWWDTMIAAYSLQQGQGRVGIDGLAQRYLDRQTTGFTDIAGKGVKQLTFDQIPLDQAAPYAAEDADVALCLYQHFESIIADSDWMSSVFYDVDLPMMTVLMQMELLGVRIDSALLQQQGEEITSSIVDIQQAIFAVADTEFNLSSPKQLQHILFEKLQLPVLKKTPKGQPSTAEEVLHQLAPQHEVVEKILDFRRLSKLKSTYVDRLPEQVNVDTGRVHTHYNQTVTTTGRLSSSDPNLQNIPIRHADGRRIRQAFIAAEGFGLLAADYSQVELRLMAHLSQDPGLLSAFSQGLDVHAATAAEIFAVDVEAVTREQRRHAKAVNFGLLYGMSSFGLAQQLGISRALAEQYRQTYFERYAGVKIYMQRIREQAAQQGYVETLLGRRIATPGIDAKNAIQRKAAERAAINAPLQGSAAEVIKLAMIKIQRWLSQQSSATRMIMQVHDELVFEVPPSELATVQPIIVEFMQQAYPLTVPLLVDVGVGNNWDEAH